MSKSAAVWIVFMTLAVGLIFAAEWLLGPAVTDVWIPAGMAAIFLCAMIWLVGYAVWMVFKK